MDKPHRARRDASRLGDYGPWAVVTGASDGIGRAIAWCLAEDRVNLVLVARRGPALEALAAELSAAHGIDTRVIAVDLAQRESIRRVVDETAALDVGLLVACAGFGTSGPFIASDLEQEVAMVDVNCRALMVLSHAFGQRLVARGRGGIVLMSSLLAFQGVARAAHYAATKAYVQTLAEGLHRELAPRGVDVVASAPGPVRSGFAARADMRMGQALRPYDVARATLRALGRAVTVRPGWLSKLLEGSLALLPRALRSTMIGLVMRRMTRHQRAEAGPVTDP